MRLINGLRTGAIAITSVLMIGCGTSQIGSRDTSSPRVEQGQAAHLAFEYRRQARDLRDYARRLEMEASLTMNQNGKDNEQTLQNIERAKALLLAAEKADDLSREYQRQVPHGQVM